jgi:hypothetical protein
MGHIQEQRHETPAVEEAYKAYKTLKSLSKS